MACGKKSGNAPTEEFILESPAPVDVSAKLSAIYRELSLKVNRGESNQKLPNGFEKSWVQIPLFA